MSTGGLPLWIHWSFSLIELPKERTETRSTLSASTYPNELIHSDVPVSKFTASPSSDRDVSQRRQHRPSLVRRCLKTPTHLWRAIRYFKGRARVLTGEPCFDAQLLSYRVKLTSLLLRPVIKRTKRILRKKVRKICINCRSRSCA